MARSPLTLAASVTAALPRAVVVGARALTENGAGRYDAALVHLEDGREAVVRVPATEESAADLAAESRALVALTPGVRAQLPFRAPQVWGESGSGRARILVVEYLPGFRIDPPHVPKGPGIATALGAALAAVHALPPSVVRTDGLPVRTPAQVRDDVARLLDRVEATHRAPDGLAERWRRAVEDDELWRFESAVVLGGANSSAFLWEDDGEQVRVTGLLEWGGLSVGDPAVDLRWLASAPEAADDVFAGYVSGAPRAPDPLVRERARLYAELEFARWLVHGVEQGDDTVIDDAVALLEALAEGVQGDRIVPDAPVDVDAALEFAERMPEGEESSRTSMQTDTYDPEMISLFLAAERDRLAAAEDAVSPDFGLDGLRAPEDTATAPVDIVAFTASEDEDAREDPAVAEEAERASQAALRWWNRDGDSRVSSGG